GVHRRPPLLPAIDRRVGALVDHGHELLLFGRQHPRVVGIARLETIGPQPADGFEFFAQFTASLLAIRGSSLGGRLPSRPEQNGGPAPLPHARPSARSLTGRTVP